MKKLGLNRQFRPEAYKMNDGLGKRVVTDYLIRNGHTLLSTTENYSFDIESEKDNQTYFSEVEMKNQWRGDWNTSWKEIRIPYRKHKLLDRHKKMATYKNILLNFFVIRGDCKYAWKIKDSQLTDERAKDVWLVNAKRTEPFYHIPYQEAELIKLV